MTSTSRPTRTPPTEDRATDWSGTPVMHFAGDSTVVLNDFAGLRRLPERPSRPTGTRPNATLDLDRLERDGLLALATSRSPMARAFRQLKLPLVANARHGKVPRRSIIMVTSAVPGEGKTFCAVNLAMSIAAEVDSSVLLIDADAERPNLMRHLGVKSGLGLFDLLTQPELDLWDLALQTNVPKLDLLPSGTQHALPGELLSSNAMDRLLDELTTSDPERIIIFDAPPLNTAGGAQALATRAGQVVVVIAASTTPRSAVREALASIEHCELVLPLLNKACLPARLLVQGPRGDPSFGATESNVPAGR